MNGTAQCSNSHTWRVSREAGRFVLSQPHLALQARGPTERAFEPRQCPTCGRLALSVKESRRRA